ncbi:hypothetical protein ACFL4I_00415 [Pseudomonadota bacterium]
MNQAALKKDFRFYTYLLIWLAVTIPIMFWPLPLFVGMTSAVVGTIEKIWLIAICALLLSAAVSDSVINGTRSPLQMLGDALWVMISVAVILGVFRASAGAYLLGMMFFLHSLRSASGLWSHNSGWWLWPAWLRDTGMALAIFFWLALWPGALSGIY